MLKSDTITQMALPRYKNPPVVEVVIGVSFVPLKNLSSVHYGAFWQEVNQEYPYSEDNAPLTEEAAGPQFELFQVPPLRRVFLIHADRTYLMQLQPDRFIHNWRKTADTDQYPNFDNARRKFFHGWELFSKFVADKKIGSVEFKQFEVTYINHIVEKSGSFPVATEKFLPVFGWSRAHSESFLPDPNVMALDLRFPLTDKQGTLRVSLKHGKKKTDDSDVLVLQFTAQGSLKPDGSDMGDCFELAHEWIVRGFTDLTSVEAHKQWGRYQ